MTETQPTLHRASISDVLHESVIPANRKLTGVHGLRAIAALMIVAFHTQGIPKLEVPNWLWLVPNRFGLGVHLFFLLSAFSLAHSTAITPESLKAYWIKRFFRIAPLFYVMLVWYQLWFGPRAISDNLLSLSFAFNLVPSMHEGIVWASWTIGVEMIFYAMLPFFLSIATARISALGLALIAVAVSAVGRMYLEELPNNYAHMAFISNLGAFCLGIFAYRLFSHSTDRVRDSRIAWVATLAFAVLLLGPLRSQALPARLDLTVWIAGFGVLALWQTLRPSFVLSHAALQFMGERSYSIYLLHPFIIFQLRPVYHSIYQALDRPGIAFLICAAMSITVVVACSTITYHVIEAPGVRLGSRLIARQRKLAVDSKGATGGNRSTM